MGRGKKPSNDEAEEAIEEVPSGEEGEPEEAAEKPSGRGSGRKRASKGSAGKGKEKETKKSKKSKRPPSDESEPEEEEEDEEDDAETMKDVPKYFHRGSFILKKSDIKWDGDKVTNNLKDLNIWKIDDKSLIQKYVPLEANDQVLHKCTSTYSGWSCDDRENYYPISEILDMNPKTESKELCVALNLEDLVKVKDKC